MLRELFFPFSFANEAVAQAGDNEQERERKGKRAPATVRIGREDLHTATLGSLHRVYQDSSRHRSHLQVLPHDKFFLKNVRKIS